MGTLVLIRHGQSQWNAENRFTGWVDVPLSESGRAEARKGGERLDERGLRVDRAFTSTLVRAVETGQIVLDTLGLSELEQSRHWQLNERVYGNLTGGNKDEARARFGEEQVHLWRRSYDIRPPGGESLQDTTERTLPFFRDVIVPATEEVEVVLVSAHGNSLRAIVKELDGLADDEVAGLELATGVPLVYTLRDGRVQDKHILD